jgi:hypothetical protein
MSQINYFAVLLAALTSFVIGGLWYSPALFGTVWQREAGDTRKPGEGGHPVKVFGASLVFALVAAFAYAVVLPVPASASAAVGQGLLVGAAIVATSFGINYQFAGRSTKLWLIDGGYHTAQFGLYGLIIGLWR